MTKVQWIQLATVVGIPFLVALAKLLIPKIPKKLIPVLCLLIGAVADTLATGGIGVGTAYGALCGAGAVGLREVYDQLSGNAAKPKEPTPPAT